MANEYFMKRCTTTSVIRKVHTKTTERDPTERIEKGMTEEGTHVHVTPGTPEMTGPPLYCWWEGAKRQCL